MIELESGLTTPEYVILLASVESWFDVKYNCTSCKSQYGKRNAHKTLNKRKSKGCFDLISRPHRIENVRYSGCPANLSLPLDFLFESSILYEKGIMPYDGNLGDQPNKMVEIIKIISSRRAEHIEKAKQGR